MDAAFEGPSPVKRRKARLVALHRIRIGFDLAETYTEEHVNSGITARNLFDIDHVEIRRYLEDYGMMDRQPDGRSYWASDEYLNEAEWSPEIPGVGSRG